jgi:ribosome biogenesis ATPase
VPCLLFFDEIDALAPRRDASLNEASSRVVSTLLAELDGVDKRAGIYVIAATNRVDAIDDAILRSGRLGSQIYVGLPSPEGRVAIVRTLLRNKKTIDSAFPQELARSSKCKNFSGADLSEMIRKASEQALKRKSRAVEKCDFIKAVELVKPSATD